MPELNHPTFAAVKGRFPDTALLAGEFRGDATLVVPADALHDVLAFLRDDPDCAYDFLSDVIGVDYLDYPGRDDSAGPASGRFAVVCSSTYRSPQSSQTSAGTFLNTSVAPSRSSVTVTLSGQVRPCLQMTHSIMSVSD